MVSYAGFRRETGELGDIFMHCVFDAYGTLFDVAAAARQAAAETGAGQLADCWQILATDWRNKQLSYSWLRAVADAHTGFWQVTCDALDWALEAAGLQGDEELRTRLLDLYWKLPAYPEAGQVLRELQQGGHSVAILSNGTPEMLDAAVEASGLSGLIGIVLSVEDAGVFKPHKSTYELVGNHYNCEPSDVLFASANGWDAAAASGFGFNSVWVNRNGDPVERLPWRPFAMVGDLSGIAGLPMLQS